MLVAAGLFVSVVGKAERRASVCARVCVCESQDESSLFASLSDCLALKTTGGGNELIHLQPLTESNSPFLLHFHSLCLPVTLKNNRNVITHFLMCGPHSH